MERVLFLRPSTSQSSSVTSRPIARARAVLFSPIKPLPLYEEVEVSTNGPPGDTGMPSFNTAVAASRPGGGFSVLPASVARVGRLLLSLESCGPRV